MKNKKLSREINYIKYLINEMDEKLLEEKQNLNLVNIDNFDNILNSNNIFRNSITINNNKNKIFNSFIIKNENKNKIQSINATSRILEQNKIDFYLDNINNQNDSYNINSPPNNLFVGTLNNNNELQFFKIDSNFPKEKNEEYIQLRKEDENSLFNGEYIDNALHSENNKNDNNFELLQNNTLNFNLRKDSFLSDISNIGYLNNFITDNENLFE